MFFQLDPSLLTTLEVARDDNHFMTNILNYIQLIIAVLLIIFILLQNRGSGLGSAFGGSGDVYLTKRGAEKTIFILTIICAFLFIVLGIIRIVI